MTAPSDLTPIAQRVLEQATERVVITDRHGVILYVNPSFERITGYSRAEALGRKPNVLKSGHHDPKFYEALWKALTAGHSFHARFVNRRKNGQLYYEEQTITPLCDAQGAITHFISTAMDLTPQVKDSEARKLAEDSLHHLQNTVWVRETRMLELKREVNELLRELGRPAKYNNSSAASTA